jgi:hypothetical protein
VSTTPDFFTSGKLFSLTSALLRAHGLPTFVRSVSVALASQTRGTDPSAALTPTSRFVVRAGLGVKRILTARAHELLSLFQDLEIFGWRDPPHGFSSDHHAVLEALFAAVHIQ